MAAGDYMTAIEFRARFPEFAQFPDPSLAVILDAVTAFVDPAKFGRYTREAHGLKAAHTAALSPHGRPLKLQNADGSTNYGAQYDQILAAASPKVAVL